MRQDIFTAGEVWHADDRVFLKSQFGWDPANWGFLAFSNKARRDNIAKDHSKPFIGLICSTKRVAPERKDQSLKICGFYIVTNKPAARVNYAAVVQGEDPDAHRWQYGLRPLSAFSFLPDVCPLTREIFPEFNPNNTWRSIGSLGRNLEKSDIRLARLRELPVTEDVLFRPWEGSLPEQSEPRACLPWTKAGPQHERGYWVEPPDPNLRRSLYIMRLLGEEANFLIDPPDDRWIVKVGLSCDPDRRLTASEGMMPKGKFRWKRIYPEASSATGLPYTFKAAVAGEEAMKRLLGQKPINHLGGEFYAATKEQIQEAWSVGNIAAWIDKRWNGAEPLPHVVDGVAVPDAKQWGDRLCAEITYRIDDLAGADAAFSELMCLAPATEAQVRSNVVAELRKEAAKVVAEHKGAANTLTTARAPLAMGTPERQADADTRRSTMRARLSILNAQNKKESRPPIAPSNYEKALIDAGVVTKKPRKARTPQWARRQKTSKARTRYA